MAIGWFGSDLWDGAKKVVTGVVDTATGAASAAFDALPGPIKDAANTLTGPVGAFVKTPTGAGLLSALTLNVGGAAYAAAGIFSPLGVAALNVAVAAPGLLKGDDFGSAWLSGWSAQCKRAAEYGGAQLDAEMNAQLDDLFAKLKAEAAAAFPDVPLPDALAAELAQIGVTPESVAAHFGISRADVAAAVIHLVHQTEAIALTDFDPATGLRWTAQQRTSNAAAALEARGVSLLSAGIDRSLLAPTSATIAANRAASRMAAARAQAFRAPAPAPAATTVRAPAATTVRATAPSSPRVGPSPLVLGAAAAALVGVAWWATK